MATMTADVVRRTHHFIEVDGVRVFYRAAGPVGAPTLLLLHGFPSASHQFSRLIDALGGRYRLVAPDYPGFGYSDAPESATTGGDFVYSFDRLAEIVEGFCERLDLDRFVMYQFDFGGPIGMRVAARHPEWIAGLVIQNANAYDEGLSPMARDLAGRDPEVVGDEDMIRKVLTLSAIRGQYLSGASHPEVIAPDGWTLDQHFLDLPGRKQIQVDLAFDYHTNVALYSTWQSWLREHHPPTLIAWGEADPFFLPDGATAYRRDLPDAEQHMFPTGHFALEENLPQIASLVADFVDRTWTPGALRRANSDRPAAPRAGEKAL
jgi:pimeloyl-ACP methyl ester carboxylesterase